MLFLSSFLISVDAWHNFPSFLCYEYRGYKMGGYIELVLFELKQTKHSKAQQHNLFCLQFSFLCNLQANWAQLDWTSQFFSICKKLFIMNRLIMSQAARKPKDVRLLLVMRLVWCCTGCCSQPNFSAELSFKQRVKIM